MLPTIRQMREQTQTQLARIGISSQDYPQYLAQFENKVKKKKADLFGVAWNGDYPDPENFFAAVLWPQCFSRPQYVQLSESRLRSANGFLLARRLSRAEKQIPIRCSRFSIKTSLSSLCSTGKATIAYNPKLESFKPHNAITIFTSTSILGRGNNLKLSLKLWIECREAG